MDRWIKDRDVLSKKIEKCNNKLAEANTSDVSRSYFPQLLMGVEKREFV